MCLLNLKTLCCLSSPNVLACRCNHHFVSIFEVRTRTKERGKKKIFPTSTNIDSILFYAEDERCVCAKMMMMMMMKKTMTMTKQKRNEEITTVRPMMIVEGWVGERTNKQNTQEHICIRKFYF